MIKNFFDSLRTWGEKQVLIQEFYDTTGKWIDDIEIISKPNSINYLESKGRNSKELFV